MSASGRIALKLRLDDDFLKALRPAWIPAGILAATALLAWLVPLPASLVGLRTYGPYALLCIGLGMAWRFNRGSAFVILASLLGAFAAYQIPLKVSYSALVVLVPLNALARDDPSRARRALPRGLRVACAPRVGGGAARLASRGEPAAVFRARDVRRRVCRGGVARLARVHAAAGRQCRRARRLLHRRRMGRRAGRPRGVHVRGRRDPHHLAAGGIAPARVPRHAHRAARAARARGAPAQPRRPLHHRAWSTSTTSRNSTTRTATTSATRC